MLSLRPVFALAFFSLPSVVHGAIGPATDLLIVNGEVSPDGFSREAVLAGGTFPGPVITGKKVMHSHHHRMISPCINVL